MTALPVEDVLALLALQAEYADGADSFDGATYAAVFTDDAVLDATPTGVPAVVGRAAIAKLMDDTFAQQTHNCHVTTNQRVVSVDGDRPRGLRDPRCRRCRGRTRVPPASTVRDFFSSWGADLDTLIAAMSRHLAPDVA